MIQQTGKPNVPDTKGLPKQPDTQSRETKPKKSKTAQRIIGYGLGGLMALEGIGATVTELTNDKPASITQTLPEDFAHPYRLGLKNVEIVSDTFDQTALKQTVTEANSVQMTFKEYEEYEKSAPPVWNAETKTMTPPIPVYFRDGRIPTLHIEKAQNPYANGALDIISIDGLEQGDALFSPFDGTIEIYKGDDNLMDFYLVAKDFQGEEVGINIRTTGLNPLIDFDHNITGEKIVLPIKRGDLIGSLLPINSAYGIDRQRILKGQVRMDGDGPLLQSVNLATAGDKAILVTQ
jgi:hypothetical protein